MIAIKIFANEESCKGDIAIAIPIPIEIRLFITISIILFLIVNIFIIYKNKYILLKKIYLFIKI